VQQAAITVLGIENGGATIDCLCSACEEEEERHSQGGGRVRIVRRSGESGRTTRYKVVVRGRLRESGGCHGRLAGTGHVVCEPVQAQDGIR
jgi:hypothetical protein